MARQRTLHPDFFTDERVVAVSAFARLMFQGLWCLADREGRLEDKPLQLKMRLFPADAVDGAVLVAELVGVGLVVRYEVEGRSYLSIPNFGKRQHVHPKEVPTKLPPPPKVMDGEETRAEPPSMEQKPGLFVMPGGGNRAGSSFPSGPSGSALPSGSSSPSGASAFQSAAAEEFWLWAMEERQKETGLTRELVRPAGYDPWAEAVIGTEGLRALAGAWCLYLLDTAFRLRGWPMAVFMAPTVHGSRLGVPRRKTNRDPLTGVAY